jgi:signal transduction histidine kinase
MRLDVGANPTLTADWPEDSQVPSPVLRLVELTAAVPADLANMWQHVLDGLTEQIALLDENWTILIVNQSWANVAKLYGDRLFVPGADYLECCRAKAAEGLEIARDVVDGIEQIIEGKRDSFQLVYRASEPEAGRDHQLCVNRFEVGGRKYASITRYDVSRLTELRRLRADFSHSVIVGQDDERRRIGREIHDSTMQLMVCMDMKIGQLKRTSQIAGTTEILDEMEQLLAEAQQEIRSISYLAHPPPLDKMALPEALHTLVEGFGRRTSLEIGFEVIGRPQLCCAAAEGAAYRIVQEALSNVHRHAHARQALVRLIQGKTMAHLVIADDGIGMPESVLLGVGLAGMRSRLSELGGRLNIRRGAAGTTVIASIPSAARIMGGKTVA